LVLVNYLSENRRLIYRSGLFSLMVVAVIVKNLVQPRWFIRKSPLGIPLRAIFIVQNLRLFVIAVTVTLFQSCRFLSGK